MSDNITLPREVAKLALDHIEWYIENERGGRFAEVREAAEALRAALAAEQPASEPVESDDDEEFTRERVTTLLLEVMDWTYTQAHRNRPMTEAEQKVLADIRTALAAPEPVRYPEKRPALEVYNEIAATDDPGSPLERLRFFCSLAMRPQDWLDVEPFFDSLREPVRHPGYIIGNHWLETAYSRICAGEAEADVLRDIGLVREEAFLTGVAHLKADNERLREALEKIADASMSMHLNAAHMATSLQGIAKAALRREDKT